MAKVHPLRAWGDEIAQLRHAAGLSGGRVVQQLASMGIRIDRRTIYAYERGRVAAPDVGVIWGMARLYGIAVDKLIQTLVSARSGNAERAHLPIKRGNGRIQVGSEEREAIRSLREMSASDRRVCYDFIRYKLTRRRRSGKSRGIDGHKPK